MRRGAWFWFRARSEHDAKLGQIQNITKDGERDDIHWITCSIKANLSEERSLNEEVTFSTRDFEQFYELQSMPDGRATSLLGSIEETEAHRGQAEEASPVADRLEEERPTLESVTYQPEIPTARVSYKLTNTPLGSGKMKSTIRLYEANPTRNWNAIDSIIEETGHLLFTYTDSIVRKMIIDQKIDALLNHAKMELKVNTLYELTKDDKTTKAIYLGGHWAMMPQVENDIVGFRYNNFVKLEKQFYCDFRIKEADDSELQLQILEKIVSEIDNEHLRIMREGDHMVYVQSDPSNSIEKEDISKNWEKAFVYDYFLGSSLDPRLPIHDFDQKTIKKLAVARNDTRVLEALA